MSESVGVSNAIGGSLNKDSSNKESEKAGEWSFEYNQADKAACLKVNIAQDNAMVIGSSDSNFNCNLDKSDVNQLIQWLYAVKSNME